MIPSLRPLLIVLLLTAGACSHAPSAVLQPHGPGHPGPRPSEAAVILAVRQEATATPTLPEQMALPADYQLILVDGRLVLARLGQAGQAVRLSAGTAAPAPAPLQPQELAAAANRERADAARLNGVLQAILQRAAELESEAEILGGQSRKVAAMLADQVRAHLPAGDPEPGR